MRRDITVCFYDINGKVQSQVVLSVRNYNPRKNEYERNCKYALCYADTGHDTGYHFSTIKQAKHFAISEKYRWI